MKIDKTETDNANRAIQVPQGRPNNMTTPPVLLNYQQSWLADPAPVKVYEKSRRIGISWAEAADAALYSAAAAGDDTWYIGYNQDMAREFIGDVGFWAKHYDLVASAMEETVFENEGLEGKDILVYRVKFASGHEVKALSSRPANLRGKQGRVIIDEAAFHPDLPGLLKAAMALLMSGGGGAHHLHPQRGRQRFQRDHPGHPGRKAPLFPAPYHPGRRPRGRVVRAHLPAAGPPVLEGGRSRLAGRTVQAVRG